MQLILKKTDLHLSNLQKSLEKLKSHSITQKFLMCKLCYFNGKPKSIKNSLANIISNSRHIGWEIVGTLNPFTLNKSRPVVVTFTGGMGAQIISAAIYFLLKNEGRKVYADLSYFKKSSHRAVEGKAGDVSHWDWQLQTFNLFPESFEKLSNQHRSKYRLIRDGQMKLVLGMKALRIAAIRQHFIDEKSITYILPPEFLPDYLCIHVRRGDYVNVATYMVDDETFAGLADKIVGLVNSVVVVSDSMIPDSFRTAIGGMYRNAIFLDAVDALTAHRVMRNARVLVCSNSQFSLVAALLNSRALVFLPEIWFSDKYQKLAAPINDLCDFQILSCK